MTERQTYKALKLIQKRVMKFDKYKLIGQYLIDIGLIAKVLESYGYELTIRGKILMWDTENWKLSS